MPYADPEKKREHGKKWRKKAIKSGYGKALYARRAARYHNEEVLRQAVEDLLSAVSASTDPEIQWVQDRLEAALKAAPPIGPPRDYLP